MKFLFYSKPIHPRHFSTSFLSRVFFISYLLTFKLLGSTTTFFIACKKALHLGDFVKSRWARCTREETRKWGLGELLSLAPLASVFSPGLLHSPKLVNLLTGYIFYPPPPPPKTKKKIHFFFLEIKQKYKFSPLALIFGKGNNWGCNTCSTICIPGQQWLSLSICAFSNQRSRTSFLVHQLLEGSRLAQNVRISNKLRLLWWQGS